jgi:RAB protein geranylgeranyltransferase component A
MENKSFRGYNIDIEPSVFFGNSITCESLKQADMDKYMDFRLVNHLLMYEKGRLEEVPLSKGRIFESKTLGLIEKKSLLTSLHTLIKLYQKHKNVEEDQNSTKEFDKGFGQVSE